MSRSPGLTLPPHLQARYPRRRTHPALVAIAVILAAATGGVLLVTAWQLANPEVRAKLLAYRVIADDRVDITWEVRRTGSDPVVCVLRAQDEKRHDIGYAIVPIPADGRDYVQLTYPLATTSPAFVAEMLGCGVRTVPASIQEPQFPPGRPIPSQSPPGYAPTPTA